MTIRDQLVPDLAAVADEIPPVLNDLKRENLEEVRGFFEQMGKTMTSIYLESRKQPEVNAVTIQSDGEDLKLFIFQPAELTKNRPIVLWIHGGGYILGDGDDMLAREIAMSQDCTAVSVDYRLAPEHPFPAGPEDCYQALLWTKEHAKELGANPDRIIIGGMSAGAGMAAGVALMNRDRRGAELSFQYLIYPMLDNLHDTDSGKIKDHPLWPRRTSLNVWEMYLDGTPGTGASPYASAARADDVSSLPPAFISVGAQDLFRDECIAYAQKLMNAGVPTELSVVPGIYHAAEIAMPDLPVCQRMLASQKLALTHALAD